MSDASDGRSPPRELLRRPIGADPDLVGWHRAAAAQTPAAILLETRGPPGASVLVWNPIVGIGIEEGQVRFRRYSAVELPDPAPASSGLPSYLAHVLRTFRRHPAGADAAPPPFVGGLVGVVGYEWAAAQEGPDGPRLPGFPDLWFGLFDRAIVRYPSGASELVVNPTVRSTSLDEAADEIRRFGSTANLGDPTPAGSPQDVCRDFPRPRFEAATREVRRRIRAGDVYQVNLAQRIRWKGSDPWSAYRALRERNPSPYSGILSTDGWHIVSSSPERLLRVEPREGGRWATTRPIAGTRPRGRGDADRRYERALRTSPKERAEHTMLVDLARNDLGRVCAPGTVGVDEWFTVERYSHVMHLVSNVTGRLREGTGTPELFRALMPGGSVTGTPKIRATEYIRELEPVPRGGFTGSMVALGLDGSVDSNLLIRSIFYPRGTGDALVYAGAGIVHASDPAREWRETCHKAAAMLEAVRGTPSRGFPWEPPRRLRSWSPSRPSGDHPDRRVLLIDNYDSFTYNLAQYLEALGAQVTVIRNDVERLDRLVARRPTHVVISPGPGVPAKAGVSVPSVVAFEGTPLLGVCLGHQSIVEAYGGAIARAPVPFHGKSSPLVREPGTGGESLLEGLPDEVRVARYHSLIAREVPSELCVTARTREGLVMAVRHRSLPTFGVQFHPESILTEGGMQILDHFLAIPPSRNARPA